LKNLSLSASAADNLFKGSIVNSFYIKPFVLVVIPSHALLLNEKAAFM